MRPRTIRTIKATLEAQRTPEQLLSDAARLICQAADTYFRHDLPGFDEAAEWHARYIAWKRAGGGK